MTATISLDVCAVKGATWLAKIVGTDPKFGLDREFHWATTDARSRSKMTGYLVWEDLTDGVYETNEPRRGDRKFHVVEDGEVRVVERAEALAILGLED
jgi:hypothetical protein